MVSRSRSIQTQNRWVYQKKKKKKKKKNGLP